MTPSKPFPATRPDLQTLLASLMLCLCLSATAQERAGPPPADLLSLDASVSSEVAPDLAIIVLAIDREGPEAGALSREVNQILTQALARARGTPDIQAATGAYTSYPRQDNKGKRIGWQVHAELVLKSKDFARLSQLTGQLGGELLISSSRFEISPELRSTEESRLIGAGAEAFRVKALAATKAFAYSAYRIREIQLGSAGQQTGPRPVLMRAVSRDGTADSGGAPLEGGRVTLSLTVSGSVQMLR